MIWRPCPDSKISRILVMPAAARGRFDISSWSDTVCTVGWADPRSDMVLLGSGMPVPADCDVYSSDPADAGRVGVRYVEDLSADSLSAAVEICSRLAPEKIVVLDSDIHDGYGVVNANPLAGGVDPRIYGIAGPEGYPDGEISLVERGYDAVPALSPGGRAWIVGGGPSLSELDLSAIPKEDLIVGCNDACRLPEVRICVFHDRRWGTVHSDWLDYPGVSYWTSGPMRHPNVRRIRQTADKFSLDPSQISFNANCGLMAVNFAYLAGAREIVLLGFDMAPDEDGRSNWHDDNISSPQPHHYAVYRRACREVAASAAKKCPGLKIVNLNPHSATDAFEKIWPEDYLPGLVRHES